MMIRPTLALACLSLLASPLAASTVRTASFDEKVDRAERIFVGKVANTRSDWDASKRWIVTYSTFKVEESFKGQHIPEITLITPGGHVGSVYQDSIGIPAFREGDEQVIFVKNTQVGPTVLYFDQGAYDVVRDERGQRIVRPAASDAVQIDSQRGMAVAAEEARTLGSFRSAVRDADRRGQVNRMQMVERQRKQSASMSEILWRYRILVALALAGAALATWKLIRRV